MQKLKDTPEANRARQQRYRQRKFSEEGLEQVQVYVPSSCIDYIRELAMILQDNPEARFIVDRPE